MIRTCPVWRRALKRPAEWAKPVKNGLQNLIVRLNALASEPMISISGWGGQSLP
jgi:hypothetical protein